MYVIGFIQRKQILPSDEQTIDPASNSAPGTLVDRWDQMEVYKRHGVVYSSPNPVTPISDQERISPYNIDTLSDTQVMGMKKNIK